MRKRVAVDVDGVLYKWVPTAWYMLTRKFPELDPDAYYGQCWLEPGVAGVAQKQWDWLWSHKAIHDVFRFGHVEKGAPDTLRLLAPKYELLAVTARPARVISETFDFLKALPFGEVHILPTKTRKTSILWDLLIDDKPENVSDALEAGRKAIVFDQPWNRLPLEQLDGCERAFSWDDVPDLLEEMLA